MITINGRKRPYQEGMTLLDLLLSMGYTYPNIVVRVNGNLIRKEEYREYPIKEGDEIRAIHLMAGG